MFNVKTMSLSYPGAKEKKIEVVDVGCMTLHFVTYMRNSTEKKFCLILFEILHH